MKNPRHIWLLYALCLTVMLAAIASISARVLSLETSRYRATVRAIVEENARLALWRMDSLVVPLISRENARSIDEYDRLIADQKVADKTNYVLTWFQFDTISNNIVPTNTYTRALKPDKVVQQMSINIRYSIRSQPKDKSKAAKESVATEETNAPQQAEAQSKATKGKGSTEYHQRISAVRNVVTQTVLPEQRQLPEEFQNVRDGMLVPVLQNDRLLLVRRVPHGKVARYQGCDLDVLKLQRLLLDSIDDLLPNAKLKMVGDPDVSDQSRMMATLPFELVPGTVIVPAMPKVTILRLSLLATWVSAFGVAVAAGVLLHGIVTLAERRGAFVSAVTHELRTPLTTFRMYTEMLRDDMVTDPVKQKQYLNILNTEADRLTHLVENVLTYARLQKDDKAIRAQPISIGELVTRLTPRLEQLASQFDMQLTPQLSEADEQTIVMADPVGVEQVLYNLVDNACKYAASATDRRIELRVRREGKQVGLCVIDHGPGIDPAMQKRVFKPFAKSAHVAADTAAGVGLGLALSRRYAQAMNAKLQLIEDHPDGTCFVLWLKPGDRK